MGLRSWSPARRPRRVERAIVLGASGAVVVHVLVDAFVARGRDDGRGARPARGRPAGRPRVRRRGRPARTAGRARPPSSPSASSPSSAAASHSAARSRAGRPGTNGPASSSCRQAERSSRRACSRSSARAGATAGLRLAGWYVPSRNRAAVLAFPGRRSTLAHARMLVRHGYGVLLVDMRGQGESEGDPNAFGWVSAADVDAAIAWLRERPDVDARRIGGLGLSVGGEVLIEAAAGNDGIRAVVSDGAGERSVRESAIRGPAGWPSLALAAVTTTATAVLSGELPPPSLETLVARIAPRPLLLVHAGRGGGGEDLNPEYHAAARPPKELWEIEEAGHVEGIRARPREYEERVVGFLDRALLGDG